MKAQNWINWRYANLLQTLNFLLSKYSLNLGCYRQLWVECTRTVFVGVASISYTRVGWVCFCCTFKSKRQICWEQHRWWQGRKGNKAKWTKSKENQNAGRTRRICWWLAKSIRKSAMPNEDQALLSHAVDSYCRRYLLFSFLIFCSFCLIRSIGLVIKCDYFAMRHVSHILQLLKNKLSFIFYWYVKLYYSNIFILIISYI